MGPSILSLVDAHVHVFPPEIIARREVCLSDRRFGALYASPDAKMASVEEVLAQMDECAVEVSVVFGFAFEDLGLCRETNDYVLEAVRANPTRLAGLSCVPIGSRGGLSELERCLDAGARGCGELAPSSADSDEITALAPLAGCLKERKLPLVVHASEPVGHQYQGKGRFTPEASVALAQAYPGLPIVLSHLGGGVLFYEFMPEVRAAMADVYYDTAAIPFLYSPNVYEAAVLAVGSEKLIFGSDYPLVGAARCASGLERLTPQQQVAVGSGNARRVFRL